MFTSDLLLPRNLLPPFMFRLIEINPMYFGKELMRNLLFYRRIETELISRSFVFFIILFITTYIVDKIKNRKIN